MIEAGHAEDGAHVVARMSTDILDRPDTSRRHVDRPRSAPEGSTRPGSYVDTDGVRRSPVRVGTYTGHSAATAPAVGSYTDTDGVRRAARRGSYVSTSR